MLVGDKWGSGGADGRGGESGFVVGSVRSIGAMPSPGPGGMPFNRADVLFPSSIGCPIPLAFPLPLVLGLCGTESSSFRREFQLSKQATLQEDQSNV